jgi:glutamine amidotransferase
MQILGDLSEEGERPGLGWIPGELMRPNPDLCPEQKIRVSHMGWNIIHETAGHVLYDGLGTEPRFYFDRSYYFVPKAREQVHGVVRYGINFAAGIRRGNIFGVQFHPENCHKLVLALFDRFSTFARSTRPQPLSRAVG